MIKKLRWKIVGLSMLMVLTVLLPVFLAVYSTTSQSIRQDSIQVLQRVLYEGRYGVTGASPYASQVQLPYFVVSVSSGTATILSGYYNHFDDTEQLVQIINACLEREEDVGLLGKYHMRYMRVQKGLVSYIAFVDTSMEESTMQNLLLASLQIGLAALLLVFLLSMLFARWAVRPVEKAMRQQRQFVSDASHELKTPLTVILSNAALLAESPQADEEVKRRWVDNVQNEAQRMKRLVEGLLTLARADNGQEQKTVFQQVELSELTMDSILLFEPLAFEAEKLLEYDIGEGLCVRGSGDQLKQLLAILLDNAIKYAPAGSRIHLDLRDTGKRLRLQVENPNADGPIAPKDLAHLFDRFYRADASRGETSGFGLGLPIAASIVRAHKGSIRAESDETGTRFTVELPKYRA